MGPTLIPASPDAFAPLSGATRTAPSGFLDIPVELRLMVYEYLVLVGKVFYVFTPGKIKTEKGDNFANWMDHAVPDLTIFRICKQVHAEAEALYLQKNLFVLPQWFHLQPPFYMGTIAASLKPPGRLLFSANALVVVKNISLTVGPRVRYYPKMRYGNRVNGRLMEDIGFPILTPAKCSKHTHDRALYMLRMERDNFARIVKRLKAQLEYLELDFIDAHCPFGCCREIGANMSYLHFLRPKVIHAVGLKNGEEKSLEANIKTSLENSNGQKLEDFGKLVCNPKEDPWAKWKIAENDDA